MDKPEKKRGGLFSKKSKKDKKDKKDKLLARQLAEADAASHRRGGGGGPVTDTQGRVQCPKCGTNLKVPDGSMRFLCGQCNTPLSIPAPAPVPSPSLFGGGGGGSRHKSKTPTTGKSPKHRWGKPGKALAAVAEDDDGGADDDGGGTGLHLDDDAAALEPPPTPGEPARAGSHVPRSEADWRLEETRCAVNAATRALSTVSQVMKSQKGFKVIADQAAASGSSASGGGGAAGGGSSGGGSSSGGGGSGGGNDDGASIYASVFGIVRSTLLVALSESHDHFAAEKEAMSLVQLAASAGTGGLLADLAGGADDIAEKETADNPWAGAIGAGRKQLLPSDIDPLERRVRELQEELAKQHAKVERLERVNANFRKTLGAADDASSAALTRLGRAAVAPSPDSSSNRARAADRQALQELKDLNNALESKNQMLLALLRDGNMVAKPVASGDGGGGGGGGAGGGGAGDGGGAVAPIAHLMRPKINLSLIQRQFEVLYEQRARTEDEERSKAAAKAAKTAGADAKAGGVSGGGADLGSRIMSRALQRRSADGPARAGRRTLSTAQAVLPKSVFDALTGKVFTKEELNRMSLPTLGSSHGHPHDNISAINNNNAGRGRGASAGGHAGSDGGGGGGGGGVESASAAEAAAARATLKPRATLSRYFPSSRFFDYFAIVAFTPPDLERDWTAQPVIETVQRYPDTDHADFPFETRLAQFACAPAALFARLGRQPSTAAAIASSGGGASVRTPSLRHIDGQRVIVHSCVLARAADLPDVYVTSLSFLANSSTDPNPQHTDETVYAMCLMSHWPLFSFQSQLLRFLFSHLYEKQVDSQALNPTFQQLSSKKATPVFFDKSQRRPQPKPVSAGGTKMRKKLAQALKQKQTDDMESDLLAYLESAPPKVGQRAGDALDAGSGDACDAAVTHELIEAVVSELIADGQDVQYLHIRNALTARLERPLEGSEKDTLSTYILQTQEVYERRIAVEAQEATRAAAQAAAKASSRPRAVLNDNGSWSVAPARVPVEEQRKIAEAEARLERLRQSRLSARPALPSDDNLELSLGPLGRGDVRSMGYGSLPMVTLWAVVEDALSSAGAAGSRMSTGGWRKHRRAAGAPKVEDLTATTVVPRKKGGGDAGGSAGGDAAAAAAAAERGEQQRQQLEIPMVLDKLWDGLVGAGLLTHLGVGLFRTGAPVLIHEKARLAALEDHLYSMPSVATTRAGGHAAAATAAAALGTAQLSASSATALSLPAGSGSDGMSAADTPASPLGGGAGQYAGFSLNVWTVAFWKTLRELPGGPVFGFLEDVALELDVDAAVRARDPTPAPPPARFPAPTAPGSKRLTAPLLIKGRGLQVLHALGAVDEEDLPTRAALAAVADVVPPLESGVINLGLRARSAALWVLDRLAEVAYANGGGQAGAVVQKLVEYFASALLPSTKVDGDIGVAVDGIDTSHLGPAAVARLWARFHQKQLLAFLLEWRRQQLTDTVALQSQSTFESVLQFQVLVRQLCSDIRVPLDGDLSKLKVMFAPSADAPAREIPLNLHGMGAGASAKFPVVDKWCYTCLFSCFSVENVVTLVRCLATSQSVLLLSDSLEMLAPCAEALRSLLYPYPCSHIYIPYLPCEQFMLASTTLPFLMGTLVENFSELEEIEFIAAYVDHDRVVPPSCAMQSYQAFHIQLPLDVHTPLVAALNAAVTLEASSASATSSSSSSSSSATADSNSNSKPLSPSGNEILNVAVDVQAVRVAFVIMMREIVAGLTIADFRAIGAAGGSARSAQSLLVSKLSEQRCRFLDIFFNTQHWQLFYEDVIINPTRSAEGKKIHDLFLRRFNPGFTNPFLDDDTAGSPSAAGPGSRAGQGGGGGGAAGS